LLDLDGWIAEVGGGFWVKIRARRVPPDPDRLHGIMYSLTLHRPSGERVVGYDNAHALTTKVGLGSRRSTQNDHRHVRGRSTPYEYKDAETLLDDFWRDVERVLRGEEVDG
jgi:hypothetical protein